MRTLAVVFMMLSVLGMDQETFAAKKKPAVKTRGAGFYRQQGGYYVGTGKHGERTRTRRPRIYKTARK